MKNQQSNEFTIKALGMYRRLLLEGAQTIFGQHKDWLKLRQCILSNLGDQGLAGAISKAMSEEQKTSEVPNGNQ